MQSQRPLQLFQSHKQITKSSFSAASANQQASDKRSFACSKGEQYSAHVNGIFGEVVDCLNLGKQSGDSFSIEQSGASIPRIIVNTLYRQNIRNYNPYIAALEQLEQQKSLSAISKQEISKLCYIGLAKSFIKTKKYSLAANYSTVNVLIRTYMRDKMEEEVKSKQENYDSVIFVPTCELALSFNPTRVPKGVEELMPAQQYSKAICMVNSIIQNEYVRYKTSNTLNISQSVNGKIILWILSILCLIFFIDKSAAILPFLFLFLLLYIGFLANESWQKLSIIVESKNTNQIIIQKLSQFFDSIKTDMIEWKVGKDFYWIELHYIKKKKKCQQHQ